MTPTMVANNAQTEIKNKGDMGSIDNDTQTVIFLRVEYQKETTHK